MARHWRHHQVPLVAEIPAPLAKDPAAATAALATLATAPDPALRMPFLLCFSLLAQEFLRCSLTLGWSVLGFDRPAVAASEESSLSLSCRPLNAREASLTLVSDASEAPARAATVSVFRVEQAVVPDENSDSVCWWLRSRWAAAALPVDEGDVTVPTVGDAGWAIVAEGALATDEGPVQATVTGVVAGVSAATAPV